MKRIILATIIAVMALSSLVACNQSVTSVPTATPAARGIDRIGILDTSGQGIVTWGGNFESYTDQGVTPSFTVTGSTGNVYVKGAPTFEGTTADAFETTFAFTDPTADRTVTFPNSSGTVAYFPYGDTFEFEGTTADDFETTLAVTDPTADRTPLLPDASGTIVLSTLATNAPDAANSVTGASNGLVYEGSSADGNETTLSATNPTADNAIVLPNMGGTVMVSGSAGKTIFGSNTITGTLAVSHGLTTPVYGFCTLAADTSANNYACSVSISGGTVTVKTWKTAGVPGDAGILVYWQVVGTP